MRRSLRPAQNVFHEKTSSLQLEAPQPAKQPKVNLPDYRSPLKGAYSEHKTVRSFALKEVLIKERTGLLQMLVWRERWILAITGSARLRFRGWLHRKRLVFYKRQNCLSFHTFRLLLPLNTIAKIATKLLSIFILAAPGTWLLRTRSEPGASLESHDGWAEPRPLARILERILQMLPQN